ncbi:MAG: alanine dehydrogenase [Anaerolineaceae bacterium]|nr:alanine dehydrogenase [Anaerolineaceae bacterium]
MAKLLTVGFPHMEKETGERRAFLPAFVQKIARYAEVYLAEGYGSRMGFSFDDYCQGNQRIHKVEREEAFGKDVIIILRAPNEHEYKWLRPGSCLVSMLHYATRPARVQRLRAGGINAISLDSIIDDYNLRLVESMRAVAWNGLEVAFSVLEKRWPGFIRDSDEPYNVVVLGTGMVGKHAVEAGTKLGNVEWNSKYMSRKGSGAMVISVGRNLSGNARQMQKIFHNADILVDATQRSDPSKVIIPNEWISWLPEHCVIADLAVDPYLLDHKPPVVRSVEGIPQGDLNKYIFFPDDQDWNATIPPEIPTTHRRATVSCYSWPGVHPEACMEHYGRQLDPMIETLLTRPYQDLSLSSNYFERALARAKLPEN